MSRYIDAELVPSLFDEEYKKTRKLISEGETHLDNLAEGFTEATRVIRTMPTADVVEVVRCEKCKHLEIINSRQIYAKCRMTDLEFKPFDIDTRKHYCSYGERKEE